jgi:hypothetical protein
LLIVKKVTLSQYVAEPHLFRCSVPPQQKNSPPELFFWAHFRQDI